MNKGNNKALSIQISLNGLSFCVKDKDSSRIEHLGKTDFGKKENPLQLETHLNELINYDVLSKLAVNEVTVVHRNELSTLVPDSLFDANHLADYLKFNAKILRSDFISFDAIAENNCQNVYVPLVNLNNIILEHYGEFTYKHSATILIQTLLNKETADDKPMIYINIEYNTFDMIITEGKALRYYNSFEFALPQDLSYYILFTMEQLNLDREKTPIRFIGGTDRNDANFEIIFKYVRDVDVIESKYDLSNTDIEENPNNHFVLLNSL